MDRGDLGEEQALELLLEVLVLRLPGDALREPGGDLAP